MMRSVLSLRALRSSVTGVPVASMLVLLATAAHAQEVATQARAVSLVPWVSLSETLTDNVRLTDVGAESEQITKVSPGIRVDMQGARLKGYFDYALSGLFYGQNTTPRQTQNALHTFVTLEALDNWAFVDFSGSISQQTISAFGTQSVDDTSVNANRAEVSNYRISPYIAGRLGDMASYEARYSRAVTRSDTSTASDVDAADGVVQFRGDSAFRSLGWSVDATRKRVDYSLGRPTEADRLNFGLLYTIVPQLSVSVSAGHEANNYTSFDKQGHSTSGVGVNWFPSDATRFTASRTRRSFGDTHNVSFEHRTGRTVWRFIDSKDVNTTPGSVGGGGFGAIYDLLYSQFASIEPDPIARAQLVNTYLQTNGISPNALVINGFLTSALSLQRRQNVSFALLGVRDTITFIATRSESRRLDPLSGGTDDLALSGVVRQRGFSVNYAHRLTPEYALGVLVSQQNTAGEASLPDATLRLINVSVTGRMGKRVTLVLGVRHVVSLGVSAYIENAIVGNLNVQF